MSPAEVIQSASAHNEIGLTCLSIYLTGISGYLIMAFVAGDKLSRSQLVIVNALYLTFIGIIAFSAVSAFYAARLVYIEYGPEADIANPGDTGGIAIWIMATVLFLGLVATLKFMADVRSNANDQSESGV